MGDNVAIRDATGASVNASTEEVTTVNGAGSQPAQHVQRMLLSIVSGATAADLPGDAANGLDVDVTRLPALAAGSAEIGGVNLTRIAGTAVDVNSGVKSNGTQRVVLATDQPQLTNALKVDGSAVTQPVSGTVGVSGTIAHDGVDSGNPIKTGGRARTALPAAVAQDDRVDAVHDKYGRRLAIVAPLDQRRSGTVNFTGNTASDVIAAPGASTALVVTRVLVVNGHATVGTKVSVRDGTTAKAVGFAAALGGGWTIEDPNGLFVATTNTAVTAICGTTGADVDVTVFGYTIPA